MTRTWHRHRGLIGYLFLVGVIVLAFQFRNETVNNQLDERDRISCEQRNRLATNQMLVLHTLTQLAGLEKQDDELTPFEVAVLESSLARVRAALAQSGPRPC